MTAVTYILEGSAHAWDNIHGATPDLNRAGGVYCVDAQQCLVLGSEAASSIQINNMHLIPLEFILATGAPHQKPFVKLLGHGGAIVADTEVHARAWMQQYEKDPEHFRCL